MRPVLVLGRHSVPSFQAMQYLAILAALILGAETTRRLGGDPNAFLVAGFVIFIPAVVAAHLGPALARGDVSLRSWVRPQDGSAFFYAVPVVVLCAPLVVWIAGLSAGTFLDAAAVGAVAGTIFGRIGCLLNGCCGGSPGARVPTQVLDAGWAALILGGLLATTGQLPAGVGCFSACVLYGAGRFLTDFTRQQRPPDGGLSQAQLASLGLIAGGGLAVLLAILNLSG